MEKIKKKKQTVFPVFSVVLGFSKKVLPFSSLAIQGATLHLLLMHSTLSE